MKIGYASFWLVLAIVLFLIPVVLVLLGEPLSAKASTICLFGGLASFAAAHGPWPA